MPQKTTLKDIAKSKTAADRLARSLTSSELQRAILNLQSAAKKQRKREAEIESRERTKSLKKLKTMMRELGLSASDVRAAIGRSSAKKPIETGKASAKKTGPRKGSKVPPKYRLKIGKQNHLWSGRGRMPLAFKSYVDAGGSLEKCLIKR